MLSAVARNSDRIFHPTRITGERFAIPELFSLPFPSFVDHEQNVCTYRRLLKLLITYSLTLVDLQLDAQNSYLFTYNTFIKNIPYTFRASLCSSSGGLRRNCIYAASGIVALCR
jgi:hypothetical protein